MKRCLLFALLALVLTQVHAEDASHIARVTLYPGSATVERVARVAPGAKTLRIDGLPAGFDARTIRVEADPGIRLGELSVLDAARADALNPRQAELEAKLVELGDAIALLDTERQSAELVTGYLKGLGAEAKSAAPIRDLTQTLTAIRSGGRDAYARIAKVAVQKRSFEKQKAVLEQELAKLAEQGNEARALTLALAAEKAGEVRISYQISGPGWQSVYRASLDSASARVTIERQAQIAQMSGEDWSNVALRLSTGQPSHSPQAQPPRSWLVSLREPRPVFESMAAPMAAAPAPSPAPAMAKRARTDDALFEVAELQTEFATEFEVPAKISLPSDGRRVTVSLSKITVPVGLRVQSVPRQDPNAYIVASAARPEGVWLPGEVQLYRDGAYIGATRWSAEQGEKLELPFGRDDLVRVKVNAAPQLSARGGLIGQRRERRIASEYVITNRHHQAVDLLLLEPAPVSANDLLKVESRFSPPPTTRDWEKKAGVMAWQMKLAPGASQSISVDYTLDWPKDSQPQGF
ncbi:DUF4139 domain-containing protein [Niveibacterium terrae]|uniref:DUF4139 domain-containing protein n=1 Tax=Niveibacterium terrae TaxID=3373598 RepID=UPI003A90805F